MDREGEKEAYKAYKHSLNTGKFATYNLKVLYNTYRIKLRVCIYEEFAV